MFGFKLKKTPVILDTNMLLLPGSQGMDVVREIESLLNEPHVLCVTQATEFELKQIIQKSKKKESFDAKLGLIMIKQQGLKVISRSLSDGYADQAILSLVQTGTIVATLDKALQKEVKASGGRVISIKNKRLSLV